MISKKDLAIVIPAYKLVFFREALESIANQTCKDFTLYVGDDGSPDDIYSILEQYKNIVNIVYHRFDENLGKEDLIGHWKRCINLTAQEKWIWLFSDDDIMEPDCVESFFKSIINTKEYYDLYRFNTVNIDEKGIIIEEPKSITDHPSVESSESFLFRRLQYKTNSFVTEYIFRRSTYDHYNGFVNFPLCWGSDDASWILFGEDKGIYTIDSARVYWRLSNINITGNKNNNLVPKINASLLFVEWVYKWNRNNNRNITPIRKEFFMVWYFITAALYWI